MRLKEEKGEVLLSEPVEPDEDDPPEDDLEP
jgi:hypothetical protein